MNKKIIALLLLVALATTSVFAFGIGGMYSNVTGGVGGALTFGLDRNGPYFGVGIDNYGVNVSAEYQLWRYDFVKSDVIDIGFHAGAGANVAVDLFNGAFGLGAGAYGLAGLHFEIDVDAFELEFFGQWQPKAFMWIIPSFNFDANWWGGAASGLRIWF